MPPERFAEGFRRTSAGLFPGGDPFQEEADIPGAVLFREVPGNRDELDIRAGVLREALQHRPQWNRFLMRLTSIRLAFCWRSTFLCCLRRA